MVTKLAQSGLRPEDIEATVAHDFNGIEVGFRIPYNLQDGTPHRTLARIRLENPPPGKGKYTQPSVEELVRAGHPPEDATYPYLNRVIIQPATWDTIAASVGKRLLIVEGEIKAAAALKLLGLAAVGIGGCDNGVRRDEHGICRVHTAIAALIRPGDKVEVVLDGDLLTNPNVNRAAGTLKRALWRLGVEVVFVVLPPPVPGRGAGLDDWLMGMPPADMRAAFDALPRVNGSGFREDRASLCHWLGLMMSEKGAPLANASNVKTIIDKHERFKGKYYFDVIRCNLYRDTPFGAQPFTDGMASEEQCWIQENLLPMVSKGIVDDSLRALPDQPKWQRNLLIESLSPWDGKPRLETMFIDGWGATDSDYVRAVGRNWLTSAMARANEPGCKVDTVLVLIGDQGIGKSQSLALIGGPYYVETHSQTHDKDFLMALHRGWLIDMAELGSMNHNIVEQVKGIISTPSDSFRPPYGKSVVEMKRHSIICGTTNEDQFLRDPTGNRRFWPIECGDIDLDWIEKNRAQLYAEAQHRYISKEKWWIMPASAAAYQQARMETHPWDMQLRMALGGSNAMRIISVRGTGYRFITNEELLTSVGLEINMRKSHHYRDLALCVKRVGAGVWEKYRHAERITLPSGGVLDLTRGYRAQVTGNPTAKVVDFPQKQNPF